MADFTEAKVVDTEIAVWNDVTINSIMTDVTFIISLVVVKPAVPRRIIVEQVHVLLQVVQGGL